LYLLDMLIDYDMPMSEIVAHLQSVAGPSYYDRIDVRFPADQRANVLARFAGEHPAQIAGQDVQSVQTLDGYKYFLDDGSWLLVRASGTEPLIRLYTEARSTEEAQRILRAGREMAGLS
jgi:phosphomannomutase